MEFDGLKIDWKGEGVYALCITPEPAETWSGNWIWVPAPTQEEMVKHVIAKNELRWVTNKDLVSK